MTDLYNYIEQSVARDSDYSWDISKNSVPIHRIAYANTNEFIEHLPKSEKPVTLVPVNAWYTKPASRESATARSVEVFSYSGLSARNKANAHLKKIGLSVEQLTLMELNRLDNALKDFHSPASTEQSSASDAFWQTMLENTIHPWPMKNMERPKELSHILGTEFDEKWAARSAPSKAVKRNPLIP